MTTVRGAGERGSAHGGRSVDWLAGGGEMGRVVRETDWAQTPLGPIDCWPQSLRTTVSLCLASNFPMSVVWGPNRVQIYNDGYWPICGAKHPRSMGQDFRECWASAWPAIGEAFERATAGQTSFLENQRMFLDRNGYLEETFFTFSFSPIRDESGDFGGLFHPVTETTANMLSERRTRALRDLVARTSKAQTTESAFSIAAETLAASELDLPFVLLYVFDPEGGAARLAAVAGLAAETVASPRLVKLLQTYDDPWRLGETFRVGQTRRMDDLVARFGAIVAGPYPEPIKAAMVLPISPPGCERPIGAMVGGVSARLSLNESYLTFYDLLGSAVTASVANARAHEEARGRAEALAEIDRAKTTFFSNVSHEFRTPLTLMLGPLEEELAEQTDPLPGPRRERLAAVLRNSQRLLKLVSTLLDFSRVEANRSQGNFEPIDLSRYTAELASVFRAAIEKAGLTLSIDCPALPEPVYVDRDMWEKIVLNLMANAFKHTFEGGIRISLKWLGDRAELVVGDTGVGIPPKDLPRLFDRFHRVRGARARTHEGTGIGLALVAQLVSLHDGSVRAESQEGRGSTFRVVLRSGSGHLPPDRVIAEEAAPGATGQSAAYAQEAMHWAANDPAGPAEYFAAGPTLQPTARAARPLILLADDNADMREYVRRLLVPRYDVLSVRDGTTALSVALERLPDLVLTDVMMPGLDGFELLGRLRADPRTRGVPVIILSARAGSEAAVEGMAAGADDYLVKPFAAHELLVRVETHLKLARVRREDASQAQVGEVRRQAEQAIRLSEAKLRRVIDSAIVGVLVARMEGQVVQANDAFLKILGYDRIDLEEGRIDRSRFSPPEWSQADHQAIESLRSTGIQPLREKDYFRKDGTRVPVLIGGSMIDDEYVGYVVDLSELHNTKQALKDSQEALRRSELQLRQSQKMEAVGSLAGGIAHDFNNVLSVILSYAELALAELGPAAPGRGDIEEIMTAGNRAAALTRQLLTFSRQQIVAPKVIDPNDLLQGMHKMLERILGEDIELVTKLAPSVGRIHADPSNIEQVIMNLVVNARDAMPTGGKLTIETTNITLDEGYAREHLDVIPGRYVMLAVTDTGSGMDEATRVRIFEPFFTTKAVGKGTGLGLSTVFGIVKQSEGDVWVYSEPGKGTTFKVYLPRVDAVADRRESPVAGASCNGTEVILLVEDEDQVRKIACAILTRHGYTVIEAGDAATALRECRERDGTIHLLLTDVVMPAMSGPALAERLMQIRPAMKLLCMSGYTDDGVVRHGFMQGGVAFVQKPFTPESLSQKVREVLDASR